jgi:hypothetical protein
MPAGKLDDQGRRCLGLDLRAQSDQGRRINGQKVFLKIISGTAAFSIGGIVGMHQLFRGLAAKQPGNSLSER